MVWEIFFQILLLNLTTGAARNFQVLVFPFPSLLLTREYAVITLTITSRTQGILRLFIETLPGTRKKTVLSTTVKPRYNEPLYSKVFGITNDFLCPVIIKCMEKNLDITKPRCSEQILSVRPCPFVISKFHCYQ